MSSSTADTALSPDVATLIRAAKELYEAAERVLEREEIRKINSPVDGRVSDVFVDDGEEVAEGSSIFSLDGRAAVAVPGEFSFYRALDVGSVGPDVRQLERILQGDGPVVQQNI